jgi:MFS-type transporter involved in bile tolerance (Atg22 family)
VFELEVILNEPLIDIVTFLLSWIQPYKTLELILVIIIVPLIMNGFAFWFQDNFLKQKETTQKNAASPEIQVED